MPARQKLAIDTFHEAMNNMMMCGKSTMDENGKTFAAYNWKIIVKIS